LRGASEYRSNTSQQPPEHMAGVNPLSIMRLAPHAANTYDDGISFRIDEQGISSNDVAEVLQLKYERAGRGALMPGARGVGS